MRAFRPAVRGALAYSVLAIGLVVGIVGPAAPISASPSNSDDAWVTVKLGESRGGEVALAVRPGTIALAHTPPGNAGGLEYLSCSSECHRPESWHRARVVSGRFVQHVSLALDPWGRPHLAFRAGHDLAYATCPESCGSAGSWSATTINQISGSARHGSSLAGVSLALDGWGRPRVAYVDEDGDGTDPGGVLEFASCDESCTDPRRWSMSSLTVPGASNPAQPSLAYSGTRPRVAYTEGGGSRAPVYATCAEHCLGPDQWTHSRLPLTIASARSQFTLRIDGQRSQLAVADNRRAAYLECAGECTSPAHWSGAALVDPDTSADHVALALTRTGAHVSYVRDRGGWLHAGDCARRCTTQEQWEPTSFPALTGPPVIGADGDRVRMAAVIHPSDRNPGRLRAFLCDAACGAPGEAEAAPTGPPAPSTSTHPPEPATEEPSGEPPERAPPPLQEGTGVTVSDLFSSSEPDHRAPSPGPSRSRTSRRFELRPYPGGPDPARGPTDDDAALDEDTPDQGKLRAPGSMRIPSRGSLAEVMVSLVALLAVGLVGAVAFRVRRRAHRFTTSVIAERHRRPTRRR